jgi:hypothetical protein
MESNNLKRLSTGEPTYWPSDRNKLPNLVDSCVTKGIPQDFTVTESYFDLSSDHSQTLITLMLDALNQDKDTVLSNMHKNYHDFRCYIIERLPLNISLRTGEDTVFFNGTVQCTGWNATLEHKRTLKA